MKESQFRELLVLLCPEVERIVYGPSCSLSLMAKRVAVYLFTRNEVRGMRAFLLRQQLQYFEKHGTFDFTEWDVTHGTYKTKTP